MKINEDHPDYGRASAYLDGQHIPWCFEADDHEGYVIRAVLKHGQPMPTVFLEEMPAGCFDHQGIVVEKVYGRVEIRMI